MQSTTLHTRVIQLLVSLVLLVPAVTTTYAFDGEDWVLVKFFKDNLAKANDGNAGAMFQVGQLYERGRGTKPNVEQAVSWYERAMDQGEHNARARLGVMYYEGVGVAKDNGKALALLQNAADAKVPNAEYYLGVMHENGDGMPADRNKAKQWYKLAIEHGSYRAKSRLQALEKGYLNVGKHESKTDTKPAVRVNLTTALRDAILGGNWQRNDLAVGFLPSSITSCTKLSGGTIRCVSQKQTRNTGDRVITYVTQSTLSGFNANDQFSVKYQNTILTNSKKGETMVAEDDEGDYAIAVKGGTPGTGLGKQKTVHQLNCEMEKANQLVCMKNKVMRLTYTNKK